MNRREALLFVFIVMGICVIVLLLIAPPIIATRGMSIRDRIAASTLVAVSLGLFLGPFFVPVLDALVQVLRSEMIGDGD